MTVQTRKIQEGFGNAARPLAKDLLKLDSRSDDPIITETGNHIPERVNFDFRQYYDRDYAAAEYEKILLKTWQMAAREEDIPNVGNRVPFDLGPGSFIISRSGPDEFKAFFNSCRHRGAMLCTKKEAGETIKCPVHGWEWKPNGKLSKIPGWWDFPDLTPKNGGLREVRLERWGGFLFINADPDAPSLKDELGVIPEHFASFDMENRYTSVRIRKLIRCNWKIGQEPFQESYHVTETHGPFAASLVGDTQTQYDIYKNGQGHVGIGRNLTPSGVPSMNSPSENTMVASANMWIAGIAHFLYPDETPIQIDPTQDTRRQMADWHRAMQKKYYNREVTSPDTVLTDVAVYFLFPNTLLHLSEMLPYSWSFTPHATDPEMCYVDLRMLLPCPVGQPRPPAAEPIILDVADKVSEKAPQLDFQANVVQEDIDNMELLQRGVRASDPRNHHSHLGLYQEMVLRHWHATYDDYMSR
ncbi:SRPBCC family protein [Novosphingobium sp. KN65.2]|uniref:aromatic ring-hydroxylating oxygenase subunit alpha n=1 Tax=Novosphingobium sp. KN65.2 TaxID=1478134 RepID=UPI0005E9D02F|nr:aromatic ring-hydroxylating dioxygenase subunit alpha [Novosphingobium sp. KN65.2]CDO35258.1 putative Rieske (2Fe-2S) domain protein [Novosphingobium sp. KN65.2]